MKSSISFVADPGFGPAAFQKGSLFCYDGICRVVILTRRHHLFIFDRVLITVVNKAAAI